MTNVENPLEIKSDLNPKTEISSDFLNRVILRNNCDTIFRLIDVLLIPHPHLQDDNNIDKLEKILQARALIMEVADQIAAVKITVSHTNDPNDHG